MSDNRTIILHGGDVEYSLKEAVADINRVIASLIEARDDGATHVVMESGNHRGARWMGLSSSYEFLDESDEHADFGDDDDDWEDDDDE